MKNLHRCPKCAGKRIWVIERYRIPSENVLGRELPVVPHQPAPGGGSFLGIAKVRSVGRFDLYLCDGCGYSELWAEDFRGLQVDEKQGIRLLDTDVDQGPFR